MIARRKLPLPQRNHYTETFFLDRPHESLGVSIRVRGALLGIGATFEGIFRKHMVLPDSIRDSAWYAIVDDDWPASKALLERKLDRHVAALTE